MKQNNEFARDSVEFYKNLVGKEIESGAFRFKVNNDMSLSISTISGVFDCKYGIGTMTWAMLIGFIGDGNMEPVENFVKGILYPTAMRFSDIDEFYVEDIYNAHRGLSARNGDMNTNAVIAEAVDSENTEE